jgi:hypothetical protein
VFHQKKMTRILQVVDSPDLLFYDFWFCGYAKEQLKEQSIPDESDLEDKLTDIWEHISGDVLQ